MKKYIRTLNGLIPIMLQGEKAVELDWKDYDNSRLKDKEHQFQYSLIIESDSFYRQYGNNRIKHYWFGKGLLKKEYGEFPCAIICEDKKVAVEKNWVEYSPQDFLRFKKMLKENGYNIKKDITYMFSLEEFIFDPFAPTFEDYQEEFQRKASNEFILSLKSIVIPSVEDNNDNVAKIEIGEVPLTREQEEDLFLAF